MPAIDMPLDELKKYMGTNPKPDDFNEYWQDAINEMRNVKSNIEIRPAELQFKNTECFHLYFTGVRGARIHAKYLRPTNVKDPLPALIMFHGYSGQSGDWSTKLSFVHAGFAVFALDCRGQSGLSEDTGGVQGTTYSGHIVRGLSDRPEQLLFRQLFLDAAQLAGIVFGMPEINTDHVMAMGGSQGGGLAVACAALESRISRVSIIHPFLSDYQRVWEMDLAKQAYEEINFYFRRIDPLHEKEKETFLKLGYIDVQNMAERIRGTVQMGITLMDTVCPPSTQFAVYNKITAEKELLIYPDYAHETPPGYADKVLMFLEDY